MEDPAALVRSVASPQADAPARWKGLAWRLTVAAGAMAGLLLSALRVWEELPGTQFSTNCQWPEVQLETVPGAERALLVRRALLCNDLEHRRITVEDYSAAVTELYTSSSFIPPKAVAPLVWAASVVAMSSQYSTGSWSASRVLGPPDVPMIDADHVNAWASLGADDQEEFLEVALAEPAHLSAVEIYETYNPGAISSIELITERGERLAMQPGGATTRRTHRLDFACTQERIAAIRVTLDSQQVAGWNELDAIGAQPCKATR